MVSHARGQVPGGCGLHGHRLEQSPRRLAFDRCLHSQDWRRSRKLVIEETFLRRSFVDGSGMHAALSSVERISMGGRLSAQPRSFTAMTNGGQCGQPGECRPCEKPSIPRSLEAHRHPVPLHARPCQGKEDPTRVHTNERHVGGSSYEVSASHTTCVSLSRYRYALNFDALTRFAARERVGDRYAAPSVRIPCLASGNIGR